MNYRQLALFVGLLGLGCGSRVVGTLDDGQSLNGGGAGVSPDSAGQSGLGAALPSSVGGMHSSMGGGASMGGVVGTAGTTEGGNSSGSGGSDAEPTGSVGGRAGMGGNGPIYDGGA